MKGLAFCLDPDGYWVELVRLVVSCFRLLFTYLTYPPLPLTLFSLRLFFSFFSHFFFSFPFLHQTRRGIDIHEFV